MRTNLKMFRNARGAAVLALFSVALATSVQPSAAVAVAEKSDEPKAAATVPRLALPLSAASPAERPKEVFLGKDSSRTSGTNSKPFGSQEKREAGQDEPPNLPKSHLAEIKKSLLLDGLSSGAPFRRNLDQPVSIPPMGPEMPPPTAEIKAFPVSVPPVNSVWNQRPSAPRSVLSSKPVVHDVFTPYLFQFEEPKEETETCMAVCNDVERYEGSRQAYIPLFNIVYLLMSGKQNDPVEDDVVSADKLCSSSFDILSGHTAGRHQIQNDDSLGFHDFIGRLAECHLDKESGQTILQRMLARGLSTCLRSQFAFVLYRGTRNYDPSFSLDKNGDTLLHLAVSANEYSMPMHIVQMEALKNDGKEEKKMNSLYFLLSALLHRNKQGKLPLDLCRSSGLCNVLKRQFRAYTTFLRFQYKKATGRSPAMPKIDRILRSVQGRSV